MKILFPLLLLILFYSDAAGQQSSDSLMKLLKSEIRKKGFYDQQKELELKQLKASLAALPQNSSLGRYTALTALIDAYKDYNFDSAHVYTNELVQISDQLKDPGKQQESKIRLGALQLSWGMYKEAFDCIGQINTGLLSDSSKLRYYEFKARALHDLSAYNTSRFYAPVSKTAAIKTLDSAIRLSKTDSYDQYKSLGQLYSISNQKEKAIAILRKLIGRKDLSIHQRAMVAIDLSYLIPSDLEKEYLLINAAIYDLRTATKQTLAISELGALFLRKGDLDHAELLLNEAKSQAAFFGNIIQEKNISITLSQLAAEQLIRSEHKKIRVLMILISVVSLFLLGIGVLSYLVYKRLQKVKLREAEVQEKYQYLDQINKRLVEDGRIKEEYLGQFFHLISGYIAKLEKLKRNTEHKLKTKNYEELIQLAKEIDIKKEREDLFYTFDTIFLKLFPNFIQAFNALLKPEDQIVPKSTEILNTNLRIFALMRLGIKDTLAIANILESSISTVYTYKNRIKTKALFHGEEFDQKVMDIKFVDIT